MIRFLKDIFKHKIYDIDPNIILDPIYFKAFCERKDLKDMIKIYKEEENHNEIDFDIIEYWQDFIDWLNYHLIYLVSELKHAFKHIIKEDHIRVHSNIEEHEFYLYEENENNIDINLSVDKIDWLETYRVNLKNYNLKKILLVV